MSESKWQNFIYLFDRMKIHANYTISQCMGAISKSDPIHTKCFECITNK